MVDRKLPPPEITDAFNRGDFDGVAAWIAKEGRFGRTVHGIDRPEPAKGTRAPPRPPSDLDHLRNLLSHRPFADWLLAAILAGFMAFATDVVTWQYEGPQFRRGHGVLSLFGLLLLCYWAVLAARRLWQR